MDEQDVRYSFTGDFSGLRDAVNGAIHLLDKYAAKFKQTDEASTVKKSKKSFQELRESLNDLGSSFSKAGRKASGFSASINTLSGGFKILGRSIKAITAVALGKWFADSANGSIKYIENLNLFRVAMGQSVEQGLKFVDTMSELYGMDPSNLYRYSGYFYELTDAIGMADEASATLSLSMTKAANDIASLFNVDIDTVVNNLASGMQGMSRAVRKYGMDIRAVTLQHTALSYGITEQVNNMSEADRMALRYLTMMNQVRNATSQVVDKTVQASGVMGDFARNIETPANQLRIFKEQVSQLGRAIGNFLIPMLSSLLPIINGVIMALRTVLTFLSALTGFSVSFSPVSTGAEDLANSLGKVANSAGGASKAVKELRKTLAPLDEINLLQAPTSPSSGGSGLGGASEDILNPALVEAIQNMSLSLEDIEMKANKVRDSLLKFFGFDYVEVFNPDTGEYESKLKWFAAQFEANLLDKFPQWSKTIEALFSNWSNIVEGFKSVFGSFGKVVDEAKSRVDGFVSSLKLDDKLSSGIESLSDRLNSFSDWISSHASQIVDFIELIGKVWLAFKAASIISQAILWLVGLATAVAGVVTAVGTFLASLNPVVLVIAAIIATLTLLYSKSEGFRDMVNSIVSNFTESIPKLWENVLSPIFSGVSDTLSSLLDLIGSIVDYIFVDVGPIISTTLNTIWDALVEVAGNISSIIDGLLGSIRGIIDFLTGVFTNDWQLAWRGVAEVFVGILNAITGAFETGMNVIIGLVNSVVAGVYTTVQGFVNELLGGINSLGSLFGQTWTLNWGAPPPAIGYLSIPKIELANGGVVTGPTNALIGEGHYDEAVIPLGNSPQMNEFADKIAGKINSPEQVTLLREQNQLLRELLRQSGNTVGIRDLAGSITRIQRQEARAGGY